jgi:site-specific recombinase XerD
MQYVIEDTKTSSGTRDVPMTSEVAKCFRHILAMRPKVKIEPIIDGYTGFLYLDKNDMPMVALHWEKYFKHILDKYNSIYKVQLPKITPHVCRHTFCSNMAKSGMDPKTLQYIMGHSDICVTYNTYTHLGLADAREEMEKITRETADKRNEAWLNRRKRAVGS